MVCEVPEHFSDGTSIYATSWIVTFLHKVWDMIDLIRKEKTVGLEISSFDELRNLHRPIGRVTKP